jgi:hypothetical protein
LKALQALYPEFQWTPTSFEKAPQSYWGDTQNLRNFFTELGKQMNITSLDDWYNVKTSTIEKYKAYGLLVAHKGSFIKR